jgi:hypothetical protein
MHGGWRTGWLRSAPCFGYEQQQNTNSGWACRPGRLRTGGSLEQAHCALTGGGRRGEGGPEEGGGGGGVPGGRTGGGWPTAAVSGSGGSAAVRLAVWRLEQACWLKAH